MNTKGIATRHINRLLHDGRSGGLSKMRAPSVADVALKELGMATRVVPDESQGVRLLRTFRDNQ